MLFHVIRRAQIKGVGPCCGHVIETITMSCWPTCTFLTSLIKSIGRMMINRTWMTLDGVAQCRVHLGIGFSAQVLGCLLWNCQNNGMLHQQPMLCLMFLQRQVTGFAYVTVGQEYHPWSTLSKPDWVHRQVSCWGFIVPVDQIFCFDVP